MKCLKTSDKINTAVITVILYTYNGATIINHKRRHTMINIQHVTTVHSDYNSKYRKQQIIIENSKYKKTYR